VQSHVRLGIFFENPQKQPDATVLKKLLNNALALVCDKNKKIKVENVSYVL